MRASNAAAVCALAFGVALPLASDAATWERLVMPGKLAEPHADLEDDCKNCHTSSEAAGESRLCRDCHEEVDQDLEQGVGFHGRSPAVAGVECRACHPDHRGREFVLAAIDRAAFDHALTDYALEGAHRSADCSGCHEQGASFREAPSDCFACHEDDDAHAGEMGRECGECHEPAAFGSAKFDHDETDFPLEGEHRDVACAACHAPSAPEGSRYAGTPSQCGTCHRLDDAHEGRFGLECGECHAPTGWKRGDFDHASTGFPLRGRHAKTACETCHVEPPSKVDLPKDCGTCHRLDDAHRGARGSDCAACHSEEGFGLARTRFDHARASGFELVGAHARSRCESCHPSGTNVKIEDQSCAGCHAKDDAHAGQLTSKDIGCAECHGQDQWSHPIRFDHDLAGFPLLGLHAAVACEACHVDARFADTPRTCVACHRQDDPHHSTLGPACADCHNPNGWSVWSFDHDSRTTYPLHGQHAGLECGACHVTPTTGAVRALRECIDCHADDDAHRGSFGRSCEGCHSEVDWKNARLGTLRPRKGGGGR